MDELLKDLTQILTTEVKSWTDDERSRIAGAEFIAARLAEMGYVKVVKAGADKDAEGG